MKFPKISVLEKCYKIWDISRWRLKWTFNTMLTISVLKFKVFFKSLNLIMESLLYFLIKLKKSYFSYQNVYEALVKTMHNLQNQG